MKATIYSVLFVFIIFFAGTGVAAQDTTVVQYWDFEESLGDWHSGAGGASIELSTEQALSDTQSVKLVGVDDHLEINLQNDTFDDIQEGDIIRYNIWISADDLADVSSFQIFWHAPEWEWNSQWFDAEDITADEWNELEFTFPEIEAPLNRIGLQLLLQEGNETSTPTLYVDDISVTRITTVDDPIEYPIVWDFEDQELGDWYGISDDDQYSSTAEITDEQAYEGTYSVKLTVGDDQSNGALVNDNQDIKAGDTISYRVYVPADQIDDINGIQPFYQVNGWGWADEWYGSGDIPLDEWFTVQIVVDEEEVISTERIGVQITGHEAEGTATIYVDYITIEEEDLEPEPEAPRPPHQIGDVLNLNGSFEMSELGETTGEPFWLFNMQHGALFEIVEDPHNGDNQVLRVDFNGHDGTGEDWNIETVNEPIYPAEGDIVRATVRLRADTEGRVARLYLGLPESGGWQRLPDWNMEEDVILSTEWQEFAFPDYEVIARDVTHEDESIRFGIALNLPENDDAVIYLDSAIVRKVGPDAPRPPHQIGDVLNLNGSFEKSELGETTGEPFWTFNSQHGSQYNIVEDPQNGDNRVLRVDFNGHDGTGEDWNIEAVNEPIYPAEGDIVKATVRLKADTEGRVARLYLGLPGSGGWQRLPDWNMEEDVTLTTEWQEYAFPEYEVIERDVTHEDESIRFGIAFNLPENDDAVIYLDSAIVRKVDAVSVDDQADVPFVFSLEQNYPNPFNPTTQIQFSLPEQADVLLEVYDILGRRVATLINNENYSMGRHTVTWNATNQAGQSLSSGVYIYRLQAGSFVETRRMIFLK